MWQTIGHENQKVFFDNALANKKFAHAYLFCGPSEIGKKDLAVEFAQKILNVSEPKRINPDLIILNSEKIKIEEIRTLISELSLRPFQYQYKIAIIDHFENVTEEAASSILKTLEEPNPSTIIILLTENRKRILSTIISRTQLINFSHLPEGNRAPISKEHELKCSEWQNLKELSLSDKLLAIKSYAELENSDLKNVFSIWLSVEQGKLHSNPQLFKNLSLLLDSISGLNQNFNKKLILQKLFINLTK